MAHGTVRTLTLTGLPDAVRRQQKAICARTITQFMAALRQKKAATGANDNGAINVWIDRFGRYRGEFMQHYITRGKCDTATLTGMRRWLKMYVPQMKG